MLSFALSAEQPPRQMNDLSIQRPQYIFWHLHLWSLVLQLFFGLLNLLFVSFSQSVSGRQYYWGAHLYPYSMVFFQLLNIWVSSSNQLIIQRCQYYVFSSSGLVLFHRSAKIALFSVMLMARRHFCWLLNFAQIWLIYWNWFVGE